MFLEISQNSQENTCARVFFDKVAGLIILYSLLSLNFVTYTKLGFRVPLYKKKMLLFFSNFDVIFQRRVDLIIPQNIISFSLPFRN